MKEEIENRPPLMSIADMEKFFKSMPHLSSIPQVLYCAVENPAPLAGMPMHYSPQKDFWTGLADAGFRHVVNLAADSCAEYDPAPLKMLYAMELEDMSSGTPPRNWEREELLIRQAVDAIMPKLGNGEGVVVHCIGGRGRSGTVIGCVLKRLGYPAGEIMKYLNDLQIARSKSGWPESEWQGKLVRAFK